MKAARRAARWPAVAALVSGCLGLSPALSAPPDEPSHAYTTVAGDTLIGLGRRLLVDPSQWPELARVNALRNPNRIGTGTALRIPLRLLRAESVPARVEAVVGGVSSGGAALQAGQTVAEGGVLDTAADGHATVRLVDGTLLRLRPGSRLRVETSQRLPDVGVVRSGAKLESGRVEVEAAPAPRGKPGFRIDTPQGVLGVRGTEFRVASDGGTRGEVLGGSVGFDAAAGSAVVPAGFGSLIDRSGQVAAPVRLLAAPDTAGLPVLQERLLLRFPLAPLPGAAAWRGQLATDPGFDRVLADLTTTTPELRFADLPDGDYLLRVRGIDTRGLEGLDATHRFRLKARPEAPLPTAPAPKKVSFGSSIELAWAANAEAGHYRLRLAATPDFKAPLLRDETGLRELALKLDGLASGTYWWQLASRRADGDQGPWGDARSFELRPLPAALPAPKVGEREIGFAWEGRPGQRFEFQLARGAAFAPLLLERQLAAPAIDLPLPGSGRFYARFRAIDADGFVGPYSTPQFFDIPNCLRDGSGACVRNGSGEAVLIAP